MKKFAILKSEINHNALKNEAGERPELSYFIRHLEGKPLRVVSETAVTADVRDEEDEVWTVRRTDLSSVPLYKTVGQELTEGRSAVE